MQNQVLEDSLEAEDRGGDKNIVSFCKYCPYSLNIPHLNISVGTLSGLWPYGVACRSEVDKSPVAHFKFNF